MAQTATIYNLTIELSDIDRSVYQTLELRVAQQPSETREYLLVRVLAYCLEYADGIMLTEGVASGQEPAILIRDLTGRITSWIEVGLPDADRLHRGMKLAGRAAVYTHRDVVKLLRHFAAARIHRGGEIPVYSFDPAFIEAVAARLDRRSAVTLSVTEQILYLHTAGHDFTSAVVEHRIA